MCKFIPILGGLMLLAGPALAQDCNSQTPPDPNASMAASGSCNSLPPGAATARYRTFGGALGTVRTAPAAGAQLPVQSDSDKGVATPRTEPVLRGVE